MGKRAASFVCAAALAVFLACLPWSGWLVRQQLRAAAGGALPGYAAGKTPTPAEQGRERLTAATHPDDPGIQIAIAFQNRPGIFGESGSAVPVAEPAGESDATRAARSLWNLRGRFPDNPSLYANMLRYMTADAVRIDRGTELRELEAKSREDRSSYERRHSRPQNTPEYLGLFDEAAALGERLDPQNGYFPAMRAIGLFAAHRDDEALAAIHRAASRPEWKEYSVDEVRGSWRLMTLTYGEPGSMARFGQMSALLFYHYAPLRNAARLATVQAIRREQSGKAIEGFYLRRDTARMGALMRTRASYLIGSLVGIHIVKTAQLRPGGVPALAKPVDDPRHPQNDSWDSLVLSAYCGYLEQIGEQGEVAFVRAEGTAAKRFDVLLQTSIEQDYVQKLRPVAGGWIAGEALFASITAIMLFGAACFALQHSKYLTHKTSFVSVLFLSLVLLGGTMTLLGSAILDPWNKWLALFQGMAFYSEAATESSSLDWVIVKTFLPQLIGMLPLSLPVLLVWIMANQSRRQPHPRAAAFLRGYAEAALPAATVLLIVYSVVAMSTLCREQTLRREADRIAANENLYLSQVAHQPLPGFSPGHKPVVSQGEN